MGAIARGYRGGIESRIIGKGKDKMIRPLYAIARDIKRDWKKPYFGAVPYLDAMQSLQSVNDSYGMDSGRGIVLYFLSNASTWRGDQARAIKAELKGLLNGQS